MRMSTSAQAEACEVVSPPVPLPIWSPEATSGALADVVSTCVRDLGCDLCAITLAGREAQTLAAYGRGSRPANVNVVHDDTALSYLLASATLAALENSPRHPWRSRLNIPLQAGKDCVGVLLLFARRSGAFDWMSVSHCRTVGELAGARIAEARRHDQTQQLAFVDGLTGFFSRAYYWMRLGEAVPYARRYGEPLAVVAYDFDGLKRANETHGYEAGSQLMAVTAQDQRRHLRRSDIPARIMGDEYAIIAPHTDWDGAQALAGQLQKAADSLEVRVPAEKTRTGAPAVFLSAISVGIAVLGPDEDAKDLTDRALLAVQADKERRRALCQLSKAA